MNLCRETFPQPLSFSPGNSLLTADERGGERGAETERVFICNVEFKLKSTGSTSVTSSSNLGAVIREVTELCCKSVHRKMLIL